MSDAHDAPDPHDSDEASPEDVARVSAALRASAPASGEPDWAKMSADIGAAVDDAARSQRRARMWAIGGAVLAAAAVAALLVWPVARGRNETKDDAPQAKATVDAAPADDEIPDDEIADEIEDEVAEEMTVPDDLGGITLDEELIDEAAAALDDDLGDAEDALDDRLLPDGAWIDELSDDDLERAVAILDGEAG